MTNAQYDTSIETGRLQLSFGQKILHYRIAVFLFSAAVLFPVVHLLKQLTGHHKLYLLGEICIIVSLLIIALIMYIIQSIKLKFSIISTALKKEEIISLLVQLSKEWNWNPYSHDENVFTAKTNTSILKNTGEQITVLIDGNNILINSINDPERSYAFRGQERNAKNRQVIITMLERADQIYHN